MAKKQILAWVTGKYIYHLFFTIAYIILLIPSRKLYVGHEDWHTFLPIFCVHLLLMLMMVGVNSSILMPRFAATRRPIQYIVFISLLIAAYVLIKGLYDAHSVSRIYGMAIKSYNPYFLNALPYAIWFAVISSMLYITQAQYESKQELKNIKINQLETELKYLKAQINPHFLFNGLNTIFGYIDKNNQQAKDALLQFSDLLRYNLYEADVDKIDISKEIGYIENYVAIQKARSDSKLKVDLKINIGNSEVKIAPLLFSPFIENAFKYVSRDENNDSIIRISLSYDRDIIAFECENSYEDVTNKNKGIGLENVKRRLDLLYKDAHELFTWNRGNVWYVKLKLIT